MSNTGWIGIDLDGTLAQYDHWRGRDHIGEPIENMVLKVQQMLQLDLNVRIFTARLDDDRPEEVVAIIERWCEKHLGIKLPVTNVKDMNMIQLWDDRAIQVIPNTGLSISEWLLKHEQQK